MNYTDKSINHVTKMDRFFGIRFFLQAIVTIIITIPLMLFGQTGHEGHSMETHSWVHWVITIALVATIGWIVFKFSRRNKDRQL